MGCPEMKIIIVATVFLLLPIVAQAADDSKQTQTKAPTSENGGYTTPRPATATTAQKPPSSPYAGKGSVNYAIISRGSGR